MEISLKQLKKLAQNDMLLKLAKELDQNRNNKLDGNEISIFEQKVYEGVKAGSVNSAEYSSIFGHDISERVAGSCNIDIRSNSLNTKNVIISSDGAQIISNAEFKPDGSLKNPEKTINGHIILKDNNGKEHTIKLTINPIQINGMRGENSKQYFEREIINALVKAINDLPEEVKSDFYNEINQVVIGGERYPVDLGFGTKYTKAQGEFYRHNSTIHLNILGGSSGQISKIGIQSETLMHEIGHSIDELSTNSQSDNSLKTKYENLKNILKQKGFNIESYTKGGNIDGYWLYNYRESVAEYYEYYHLRNKKAESGNQSEKYFTKDSRYYMIHQAATSEDPEIQKAFQEFESEFAKILNNSRSLAPAARKGNDTAGMLERINYSNIRLRKDDNQEAYLGFISLPDIINSDKINFVDDITPSQMLKEYYLYLNDSNPNEEWNKIFKELDANNTKEWSALKDYFKTKLNELSYNT